MVVTIGSGSVACLKMSAKWKMDQRLLSLSGAKGETGAGFIREVTRSCAASVADSFIEAWVMLTWDRKRIYFRGCLGNPEFEIPTLMKRGS